MDTSSQSTTTARHRAEVERTPEAPAGVAPGSAPQGVPEAAPELDRHVLGRTADHLYERYSHVVDRATVERTVEEAYLELSRTATVTAHLPLLAGNFAESRLRSMGINRGVIESPLPRVLFVDDLNAGRSQMAASFLLRHSGGQVAARSAGLHPAGHLHPDAMEVMAEVGTDLGDAYPKPLTADVHEAAQYVVTLDCADAVEQLPGTDYRDWEIPNFVGRSLADVREMRDDLERRVLELLAEVAPESTPEARASAPAGAA